MSILVNNDLIWVAIPKCASISVAHALKDSSLHTERYKFIQNFSRSLSNQFTVNNHIRKKELVEYFGSKKTFCIKRDWFERWLSCLSQLWFVFESTRIKPNIAIEELNNDFIYSVFNEESIDILYNLDDKKLFDNFLKKIIKNPENLDSSQYFFIRSALFTFRSQNFFTENEKCDFEFDIKKLYLLEDFILNRYGVKIKISHENASHKKPANLILDQKLKDHMWNIIESPFVKKLQVI